MLEFGNFAVDQENLKSEKDIFLISLLEELARDINMGYQSDPAINQSLRGALYINTTDADHTYKMTLNSPSLVEAAYSALLGYSAVLLGIPNNPDDPIVFPHPDSKTAIKYLPRIEKDKIMASLTMAGAIFSAMPPDQWPDSIWTIIKDNYPLPPQESLGDKGNIFPRVENPWISAVKRRAETIYFRFTDVTFTQQVLPDFIELHYRDTDAIFEGL